MDEHIESLDQDFLATALLAELKASGESKDKVIRGQKHIILSMLLVIIMVVGGFLWYLNQYDFTSYENVSATGVYTLMDSEGNVIAQDLSSEDLETITEVLNGTDQSPTDQNED